MKPFLHIAVRELDAAAAAEREAILRASGLDPDRLVLVRGDEGPLPDFSPEDFSGVFVGGSSFTTSDPVKCAVQERAERELGRLVDLSVAGALPMLGLCYGIGVITQHVGGRMDRVHGERTGTVEVRVTDAGRRDPVFAGLADRFRVCTGHKEAVSALPEGAAVLLEGDACPVQAIRVGAAAYATQFHAELDPEQLVDRMILYRDSGYFPAHEFDQVAAEVRAGGVEGWPALIVRRFAETFAR